MSLTQLLTSMEKMVPEGRRHMRPFQFHLKEHWSFSLVIEHPPSLVRDHFSSPRVATKSCKRGEVRRPSPQRPQYTNLTDTSNGGWGAHLEQVSTKGLWSDRDIKPTHICYRVEGSLSGDEKVQGPAPNQTVPVGCYRQLNSSSLHKQTRRNPLGGDACSPVENHDLVPSLPDNS